MLLSNVDFPEPDGPIIDINSPFSTSNETFFNASVPLLYFLETFFILNNIKNPFYIISNCLIKTK